MKAKMYMLLGVVMFSVVVAAFNIRQVHAETGCFFDTEGNPFEEYICWLARNGISYGTSDGYYSPKEVVTREQMAAFLNRQHWIPPTNNDIRINAGIHNWKPLNSTDPLSFEYDRAALSVKNSVAGDIRWLSVTPDIPFVLYDRVLRLRGVEFCYHTWFDRTEILKVELNTSMSFSGGGYGYRNQLTDSTIRAGRNCDSFVLSEPVLLTTRDGLSLSGVSLFVQVRWKMPAEIDLGRTTFIFESTNEFPTTEPKE